VSPGGGGYPFPTTGRVWDALGVYESTELVRDLCKAKTGRRPSAAKAREIASHFAQARQYFRSAEAAGALVRPLLLYYGAMALARGLVLFLDPGLSKVAAGHGLGADGWADLNAKPDAVPDLAVSVHASGTFPELLRVTGNADRTKIPAEDNPFEIGVESPGASPVPAGTDLTLREILGQIPDVRDVYEHTFGEHGGRVRCEVLAVNRISGRDDEGFAWVGVVETRAGLPNQKRVADGAFGGDADVAGAQVDDYLYFAPDRGGQNVRHFRFNTSYDREPSSYDAIGLPVARDGDGQLCLKLPTAGGVVLSNLLSLYLAAYASGMLVRYHPGYWTTVAGGGKGDKMGPIISAAASAVEERFPGLVLGELEP
jgi:hypothetical protein